MKAVVRNVPISNSNDNNPGRNNNKNPFTQPSNNQNSKNPFLQHSIFSKNHKNTSNNNNPFQTNNTHDEQSMRNPFSNNYHS